MKQQTLDPQTGIPFYIQLRRILIEDVLADPDSQGRLPPLREIARKYGVSLVTVVKATEKLKTDGLIAGGRGRGKGLYIRDQQRLRDMYARPKMKTIAVAFRDINNAASPFLSELIRNAAAECGKHHHRLQILALHPEGTDLEITSTEGGDHNLCPDGLILCCPMPLESALVLKKKGIPFVWMHNTLFDEAIYGVSVSLLDSLNLALTHFSRLGYRKIAFLSTGESREKRLFETLCATHNLKGVWHQKPLPEEDAGYLLTREVLDHDHPDALITHGSRMSASALAVLSERGMSTPKDIALVGIVSGIKDSFIPRNISVLLDPLTEMVPKAMEMLSLLMKGEVPAERNPVYTMKFIIRGSCGFPMEPGSEIVISDIDQIKKLKYPKRRAR